MEKGKALAIGWKERMMGRMVRNAKAVKVAMVSLGCPKNLVDSEKMLALLAGAGAVVGAPMEEADVIVVNTCGFLGAAREESLGVIREALEQKAMGRARRVVVAGCLVNRDGEKLFEEAPGIDAVVGVNDREAIARAVMGEGEGGIHRGDRGERRGGKGNIPSARSEFSGGARTALSVAAAKRTSTVGTAGEGVKATRNRKRMDDSGRFRLTPRHTAYLRISEGCSRKCSFCTIPAIRGPFRSKAVAQVLAEARELVADGAVELNVIGQDTTGYGADLPGKPSLASLLRELDALEGLEWIRLLYAYPWGFSPELFAAMRECSRVVPYVDVPLQHVSTPVLRRMRRGTTKRSIERLMRDLRAIEGMVVRTTFIVGFPGETQEEFEELLEFVRETKFDAMGVFAFSPEEGTPAAGMKGQVSAEVKAARLERLMLAQQEIAFAANAAAVGSPITVLVDGQDARGRCVGRYYGQAPDIDSVCLLKKARPAGEFVIGKVAGWDGYDLVVK